MGQVVQFRAGDRVPSGAAGQLSTRDAQQQADQYGDGKEMRSWPAVATSLMMTDPEIRRAGGWGRWHHGSFGIMNFLPNGPGFSSRLS